MFACTLCSQVNSTEEQADPPGESAVSEMPPSDRSDGTSSEAGSAVPAPDELAEVVGLDLMPFVVSPRKTKKGHLQADHRDYGALAGVEAPVEGWAVPRYSSASRPLARGGQEGIGLARMYAQGRELCDTCLQLLDPAVAADLSDMAKALPDAQ